MLPQHLDHFASRHCAFFILFYLLISWLSRLEETSDKSGMEKVKLLGLDSRIHVCQNGRMFQSLIRTWRYVRRQMRRSHVLVLDDSMMMLLITTLPLPKPFAPEAKARK